MKTDTGAPELDPASFPEGVWEVPLELVLHCTRSIMKGVVRKRSEKQDWPYPTAIVFARGKRFFAEVRFHGANRPALLLPLEVWITENL